MKKIYITFSIILIGLGMVNAQQSAITDYFVNTSQTRTYMNPAFRPKHGYIGVPFLSNIYVDAKTNTLNLDHLTFNKSGYNQRLNFMHPAVTPSEFLNGMSESNYLAANMSYKIMTAGFYTGAQFWTIDLGVRIHADVNIPKGVFAMLKEGFSSEIGPNSAPIKYDLKNIGGTASAFGELALGYSQPLLNNSLHIGARTKFLLGIGNFDLNINRLDMEYGYNQWKVGAQASLSGSLSGLQPTYDEEGIFDGFDIDGVGISGWGLGFDLGVEYDFKNLSEGINIHFLSYILSRTKVSMAFTDIGFISWSGKNSVNLTSQNTEATIDFGDFDFNEGSQLEGQLDSIFTSLEKALDFAESGSNTGRTSSLRANMNIGLEYEAWKNNMTVGLLSSTQFEKLRTITEFTISTNFSPARAKWFAASLSYSFVHSQFNTLGLAIHLAPRKGINLFIASDYVIPHVNSTFIPTTSKALNVQFGLTIPLGSNTPL